MSSATSRCAWPSCGWRGWVATAAGRRSAAGAGGRNAGQTLAAGHRDHQGRDPAAVRHPAAGGGAGVVCAGARHPAAGRIAAAHPSRATAPTCSPIAEGDVPDEVAPLVRAINDLLQRLDRTIATQRHFLADAAHQLKTPLAGLRMQAELAPREIDSGRGEPAQMKHSLQQIAKSTQRAAHMVNQLLAMARAEDAEQAQRHAGRSTWPRSHATWCATSCRARWSAHRPRLRGARRRLQARTRGCSASRCCWARWCATWSTTRCSTRRPAGVTARVLPDPFGQVVVLQVEDSGPGIAPAEREAVFRPFYRALGTRGRRQRPGPGHRARVAQRHGADISIGDARPPHRGGPANGDRARCFTVRFPARATVELPTARLSCNGRRITCRRPPANSAPAAGSWPPTSGCPAPAPATPWPCRRS